MGIGVGCALVGTEGAPVDIELVAASLRADSSDLEAFVETLATKLEDVIPSGVKVERRRAGLLGPKLVRRVTVDAGDRRLELRARDQTIETVSARLSGGIVLKSERLGIEAWLTALGESLASEARRNETTRRALERLLIQ